MSETKEPPLARNDEGLSMRLSDRFFGNYDASDPWLEPILPGRHGDPLWSRYDLASRELGRSGDFEPLERPAWERAGPSEDDRSVSLPMMELKDSGPCVRPEWLPCDLPPGTLAEDTETAVGLLAETAVGLLAETAVGLLAETAVGLLAPPHEMRENETDIMQDTGQKADIRETESPPPLERSMRNRHRNTERSDPADRKRSRSGLLLVSLAVIGLLGCASSLFYKVHNAPSESGLVTKAIQDVRNGERVLGTNPIREEVETCLAEPEPETWRQLTLVMTKPSGKRLDIMLLRSLEWIAATGAKIGSTIDLDLAELGAAGPAKVVAIGPCPPVKRGTGNVVTGTFKHEPDNGIVNLFVEGSRLPIGVTPNHPFWSEDRQAFVPAGELKQGETLHSRTRGIIQVAAVQPRSGTEPVYNLEVHGEHVYEVTADGVLVHNTCPAVAFHGTDVNSALDLLNGGSLSATKAAAKKIDGNPAFFWQRMCRMPNSLPFDVEKVRC